MAVSEKPRILGIVAEYDPFHRGHERHLSLAREAVRPDYTYVALSGCLKQRGELSMLSPYDRARCALAAGADAVFALPTVWTVRDAEHYSLGAVSLLGRLGVTHLSFGAEDADLTGLEKAAEMLEDPPEDFRKALRTRLDAGYGYPGAVSSAMEETDPESAALLQKPNNTLAVCYLRAIRRLGLSMQAVPIPRSGSFHAETIHPGEPSASALREALCRGDYVHALAAVPESARKLLREAFLAGRIPDSGLFGRLLIRRLRTMAPEEIANLPDVSEGLEDRLRQAARQAGDAQRLIGLISGKRYPRARISRICAWAMLEGRRENVKETPLPERGVLLGLRKNPQMTALWRQGACSVTTDWDDETDLKAWRLWAQCAGYPDTLPWTEKVVSLT